MRGLAPSAVLAFLLAFGTTAARAQDAEVARAHFEAGTHAFETGDYERAVSEFEQAHAITQHPDILFNIYSAAERAGSLETAERALVRYLEEGSPTADERPALEQRLAHLRERIAARAQGRPEPAREETHEQPADPPDQRQSPPAPAGIHPAGIAVVIAAGVIGLTFGGLAIASQLEYDALKEDCGEAGTCTDAELDSQRALNIAVDVTWITAATAAVIGIVLIAVLPGEGPAMTESAWLAPYVTTDGAGLASGGRF